jgi:transmembrane sensor
MATFANARWRTTFAAIITLAAAALLSPMAFVSAWVCAKSLPLEIYSTAVGEIRSIVLDEWISLRMNTDSGAEIRRGDDLCEIRLDHGEALFEVKRDSPRPLRVVAGITLIDTRAAKFSVRVRDRKNMDLLVSTGQVTVGTTLIRDHQWARISPDGMRLRILNEAETHRRLEWTRGNLIFAGETLADAVDEFNRYNIRKLVIADRTISVISIGGNFRASDLQSFVAALRPMGIRSAAEEQNLIRLMGTKGAH